MGLRFNANTGKIVSHAHPDVSLQRIADSLERIAECLENNNQSSV